MVEEGIAVAVPRLFDNCLDYRLEFVCKSAMISPEVRIYESDNNNDRRQYFQANCEIFDSTDFGQLISAIVQHSGFNHRR